MHKISLIHMPFTDVTIPSLALTQLKALMDRDFKDEVSCEILYLNHEIANYIGLDFYQHISLSGECLISGLGDWFFRQSSFPELQDNSESYFARYYPRHDDATERQKALILEKRAGVDALLDELIDTYAIDQADLVGFSSTFFQTVGACAMARKLKDRNSNIVTVMGGSNCQHPMGEEIVNNVPQIDYVFSGPGLKSFPKFVRYQLDRAYDKCETIDGVFSKNNRTLTPSPRDTKVGHVSPSKLPTNGEDEPTIEVPCSEAVNCVGAIGKELPVSEKIELDYEPFLASLEYNFPDMDPMLLFETSRGCWWGEKSHCTFCGENGITMKYRAMAPDRAIEQFQELFRYADRCDRFFSTDTIMQRNYVREVFEHIDPPENVMIGYEVKADFKTPDLQTLSTAGVKYLQPGIEAISTETLNLMKKGTTSFSNLRFLMSCLVAGVYPIWNILVGSPGESEQVYKKYLKDLPLLRHIPPPTGVYPVRFDRFSGYQILPEVYNLQLKPYDFYELIYPQHNGSLHNLAYYFEDENLANADYFIAMSRWYQDIKDQVDRWQAFWLPKTDDPLPTLRFNGNGSVLDTRSGNLGEHHIGSTGHELLEFLSNRPKKIADIADHFDNTPQIDAETELARLRECGLVFEENGRYMSLVLPRELNMQFFQREKARCGFEVF